jgi:outer membrane protein OmpA-like peptidoglycan-associated protein
MTSGLAIGAAAGGPIGALIGAAAGAWLGDRYHRQSESRAELQANLDRSEADGLRLARDLQSTKAALDGARNELEGSRAVIDELRAHNVRLDAALARSYILETTVSFKTGETAVTPDVSARLKDLGAMTASMPHARIHISGYADPRGTEDFNNELSLRRAEAVAEELAVAGVKPEQIVLEAFGESRAQSVPGDLDGYALERRVNIRIETDEEAVAQLK